MLMPDIVLDTNAMADLLAQFFGSTKRGKEPFQDEGRLPPDAVRRINQIRQRYVADEGVANLVVASSLAFVEMVRHWDDIVRGRFEPHQLAAFLQQPPAWFSVAPMDEDLVGFFCEVQPDVLMPDRSVRPTEWTDAVHVATVFSRGNNSLFVTSDRRLRQIGRLAGRLL